MDPFRLDAMQTTYAKTLIDDLNKVARARELAYQHQQACDAEGTGALAVGKVEEYLDGITEKGGVLPPSKSELQEERSRGSRTGEAAGGAPCGRGARSSSGARRRQWRRRRILWFDDILEKEGRRSAESAEEGAAKGEESRGAGRGRRRVSSGGTPAPGEAGDLSREEELDEQFDREMRRIFALS